MIGAHILFVEHYVNLLAITQAGFYYILLLAENSELVAIKKTMKLDQVHCEHMQYSLSRKRGRGCGGGSYLQKEGYRSKQQSSI